MNSPDMATSGSEDCSQPKKAPVISEPYECPLCQESFTSLLSILQHIKSHNRDNPWSCQGCEIALDEGVLHPHNDKCPASWNDSDDSWEDTDGNTSSKCTLCPFTSDDLCTLLDHIQLHVRKRRDASEFMSDDENKTYRNKDKTYRDNIYNCTECEFYCVCPDKLAAHMQLHIPGAALECKNCEVTFQSLSELRKHKKSHDVARPFGCPKCPARFTRADNMKIHLQHHNGEAQFSCRFCRYMTNSRVRLTTHYRHHQKAGYKSAASTKASGTCPVCSKGFISYPLLLFHIKAHCVSPPFRCPSCQKPLGSSDKALEHFLSHIESVTLSCAYCNFKCFEDSTIHHHLGTQHGSEKPFQCELCNYRFGSFQHWKRHQLVHSGEKPYVCDICGTRFCASGNRKAHMIKLHGHYIPLPRGKRCKAKEASATKKNEASTTKPIIDIEYEEN